MLKSNALKPCPKCGENLPLAQFNGQKTSGDGRAAICRDCVNKRRREISVAKKSGPERMAERGFQRLAAKGDVERMQKLLEAATPRSIDRLIGIAGKGSHIGVLRLLLHQKGVGRAEKILFWAVQGEGPEALRLASEILSGGLDPNRAGMLLQTNLMALAATRGNTAMVRELERHGMEYDIFPAAALGDFAHVQAAIASSPRRALEADAFRRNPLYYCCASTAWKRIPDAQAALAEIVTLLIRAGAPVNPSSAETGASEPLRAVAEGGNEQVARILIEKGALPSREAMLTALGHYQRHGRGNYAIAALLHRAGFDLNAVEDRALIHAFANHGDLVAVKWLLDHGADPNIRAEDGRTPLHDAVVRNDSVGLARMLLDAGADLFAKNGMGAMPVDLAVKNGKTRVAQFLAQRMNKSNTFMC